MKTKLTPEKRQREQIKTLKRKLEEANGRIATLESQWREEREECSRLAFRCNQLYSQLTGDLGP